MHRAIPEPVAARNEVSDAAHAVLDCLETNQQEWANHQSWQDQITDSGIAVCKAALADIDDMPLAEVRTFAVEAAARLIDAIGEIDRCMATGEV